MTISVIVLILHAALNQVRTQDGGDDRYYNLKNSLNLWPFHNRTFLIRENLEALIVLAGIVTVTAVVVTAASVGAATCIATGVGAAAGGSTVVAAGGLWLERSVVGLLEDHILDECLRDDVLLHDLAL